MMPGAAAADLTLELNLTVGAHMSRIPGLALTTFLLISSPTLLAQGLGEQVEQLLKRADLGELQDVWELAYQVSDLEGSEDALIDAIVGFPQPACSPPPFSACRGSNLRTPCRSRSC